MKKILSNVLILLAFLSFFALPSYAQSSGDNTITGTIYDGFNNELVGFSFTVTVTRRDGVPISTAPKTVTTITAGALPGTFQLPRKSFVTFRGAFTIGRYNFANGLSMFIPDESTTSIYNLLSVEDAAAALVAVSSAPSDATYWTSSSNGTLSAEVNLGALTSGLLKHTVSGSVSTPATATAGTDYVAPGAITGAGLTQSTGKLLGRYSASTGAIQEITISTGLSLDGSGNLTATASGGGTWGSITGTLSAQTDLQSALDAKQALDSDLTALAGNSTNGLWARTGTGTGSARTITGTADKITVTDGDGVAGNPTLTIASTYAGQTSITTLGTIATGTWNGTVIGSAYGGAGTVNGILKANGSGTVSAATSGTDYAAAGAITGSGQTMATGRLLGRTTASTGAVEEITPAATFSFTAGGLDVANLGITNAMLAGSIANAKLANSGVTIGSTSVSLGATASTVAGLTLTQPTIADFSNATHNHSNAAGGGQISLANAVTGDLPFANFVQAGSAGFVGATGAGDYSHRTPTQVTAALDAFVGDSGSGGTKGLVPAPTMGDATKYLKGDGTWGTVSAGIAVGGAISSGSASRVLYENSSNQLGEAAGFTFDGTSALTLGVAGTSVGSVGFKNATSGTITVQPVTGALGTVTLSLPATTGTLACLACAQTFSAAQSFSSTITQTSASATAFESGPNGGTNPVFRIVNSTASQASGVSLTGKANGTAPEFLSLSRTQQASSIAGNGLSITADPAIAGASNAGAAAGGSVTITAGNAARLTSGNANGGNVNLVFGALIGTGRDGILTLGGTTTSFTGLKTGDVFGQKHVMAKLGDNTTTNTGFVGNRFISESVEGNLSTVVSIYEGNAQLSSGGQVTYNSAANLNSGSADTGSARSAAGVVKPTNGSTGAGTFSAVAVTPAQITADQNNYAPGVGWFHRWSSDASRNVTGLVAGVDGQVIEIWNVGAQNIVLINASGSSTSANQFASSTGADLTLAAGKCAMGRYDATSTKWRVYLCN